MGKRIAAAMLIAVFLGGIYSWKLPTSFFWNSDWTRDLYDMVRMARGDFQIVGPALSGGLFAGPYYYWTLLPFLVLSGMNEQVVLLGNAMLFAVGAALGFMVLAGTLGIKRALGWAVVVGLNPFWITQARQPANGFTYLPLLLFVYTISFFKKSWSGLSLVMLGWCWGVLLNFHPTVSLTLVPVWIWLFSKLPQKRQFGWLVLGTFAAFVPLLAFEAKNDWPIIRGLVFNRQYEIFSQPQLNPYVESAKSAFYENFIFLGDKLGQLTNGTLWWLGGLAAIVMITLNKLPRAVRLAAAGVVVGLTLASLIVTKVYMGHYLFPVVTLAIAGMAVGISGGRLGGVLTTAVIAVNLLAWPRSLWMVSRHDGQYARRAVEAVINRGLVKPGDKFSVMGINSLPIYVPYGHEYRYYFIKSGYSPLLVNQYNRADKLLVFSEIGPLNKEQIKTWESEQFGAGYLNKAQIFTTGQVTVQVYRRE